MKSRQMVCVGLAALLLCMGAAQARPAQMPPAVVDGEIVPYSRVKKFGRFWYPASIVGHHRGVIFTYDYGTGKLFANGIETSIETVVVDDVVYVDINPELTHQSMRPGMQRLSNRRAQLEEFEKASPHLEGRTDTIFMSENVPGHVHPWAEAPSGQHIPTIDLDPTGEAPLAPHMRPGARPPSAAPAALPNRLTRPGEIAPSEVSSAATPVETIKIPPTQPDSSVPTVGIPAAVTEKGGPISTAPVDDPGGLQPIPEKPVPPAPDTSGFNSSGNVAVATDENSVFKVEVTGGVWELSDSGSLLRLSIEQTNLSRVAQSNLGSFAIRCEDGTRVEASRMRSSLPDGVLDSGAYREGDLVFRITDGRRPQTLELEGALPLSVSLQRTP